MPYRRLLVLLPGLRRNLVSFAGDAHGQRITTTMRPSREEFHALAATHTVVPVWAEVLGDLETPVAAYLKLVGEGEGFLLESVEHAERWARYSFVGHDPVATLELRDGLIEIKGQHLSASRSIEECSRHSTQSLRPTERRSSRICRRCRVA